MTVSFQLRMPNVGSYNGRWTGESNKYYLIKRLDSVQSKKVKKMIEEKKVSWYYDFEDGWGASISMDLVDYKEANKRRKITCGFSSYEWMVDEILEHGRILKRQERKDLQSFINP